MELRKQLENVIVPSPTQFYANPDNIERLDTIEKLHVAKQHNEDFLKENAQLHEKMDKYDADINDGALITSEITPCVKTRQKCYPEPSMMIRCVKEMM
ncbi:hypothetical protein ACS0TY_006454 [Phlomoides rotata]